MSRLFTTICACVLVLTGCQALQDTDRADGPPNIVFILVDDLGIECLTTYGGVSYDTPNIDRLAAEGMRFTHCFSNPYCSPSRAELLTGRYPFANGITAVLWNLERHHDIVLDPATQPSFARQLGEVGYATAIAGKWQVSFLDRHNTINDFGFDTYQCWQIHDAQGNRTTRFHRPHFNRDGTIIADQIADHYGPEVNVDFLTEFIHENAEADRPFLAYYTCLLPHFPWVPTPDSEDQSYRPPDNRHKGDPRYFPDMVDYMDQCVGRLMQSLEDAGVADNTVVIFLADNGTDQQLTHVWGEQRLVIHGGKGSMTDAGTHVPLIVRWPTRVEAGAVREDLIDFADFLPTLCGIAGAPLPDQPIHGVSFLPQLLGQAGTPRTWVHVQNRDGRYLRTTEYVLNDAGLLWPVVGTGHEVPPPIPELDADQAATRCELQHVFHELGE